MKTLGRQTETNRVQDSEERISGIEVKVEVIDTPVKETVKSKRKTPRHNASRKLLWKEHTYK